MANNNDTERVTILERYQKIDGVVYYEWKLLNDKNWRSKPTAMKDTPYVQFKYYTPQEWNLKELELLQSGENK